MRDYVPPTLLIGALALALSGVLDRAGLAGASQGLAIGAAICAPVWLFNLWRRSRGDRSRRDDEGPR
jgi:hypothetical protein